MILTVCLNPSFDRTVGVDSFRQGETNRTVSVRTDPGGKGLNVCRVLNRLGLESRCVTVMGQDGAEKLCRMLDSEAVDYRRILVPGAVRTNLKIVSLPDGELTEVNEPGPALSGDALKNVREMILREAADAEMTVLTGSLPVGCPASLYGELIRELPKGSCILDASGQPLTGALNAGPMLVKPNRDELAKAVGRELNSMEDIREAATELIGRGAGAVLVSLGGRGAMLVKKDFCMTAPSVPVEVRSTVGAGDAMVGALIAGLRETGSLRKAFRWAVAGGTCSVMTEGTGLIEEKRFREILERVRITEGF